MTKQDVLDQYRYRCDKCKKKVNSFQGRVICNFCRICLCEDCTTTLTILNMYVAFTKEKHEECGKQVNLID